MRAEDPVSILVASCLVVVAAIAGLLVGAALTPSEPPSVVKPAQVSGAGVRLELPAGWARGGAADLPGFERALWLRDSVEGTRAAIAVLPAASPSLLPASLPAAGAKRATVSPWLGYQVWRYQVRRSNGSNMAVYVSPTTKGIATVACLGATDADACDGVASAIVVPNSRPIPLGKRAALVSGLPAVVSDLAAARDEGVRALDAATKPAGQGEAAAELAGAHTTAAAAVRALSSNDDSVARATAGALSATAGAYAALAAAARHRVPKPYADAGRALAGADADLRSKMTKLAAAVDTASVAAPAATTPLAGTNAPTATTPTATKPAGTKPAAGKRQAVANRRVFKPVSEPETEAIPVATAATSKPAGKGFDLTIPLLVLVAGFAIFIGVRTARRAL